MSITGVNDLGIKLVEKLNSIGVELKGAFCSGKYCVTAVVNKIDDVFALGAQLGTEFGEIEIDQWTGRAQIYVIFPKAHCRQ